MAMYYGYVAGKNAEGHLSLKSQNNFQSPEQKMPAPGLFM